MKLTKSAKFALAIVASAGLALTLLSPAQGATRSTVIIHETNPVAGLNCSLSTTNNTTCTDMGTLQGMGFNYYNGKMEIIAAKTRMDETGSNYLLVDLAYDIASDPPAPAPRSPYQG